MARTNQNPLTKYYSGKFGRDFSFRDYDGMSTLAKLPGRKRRIDSEKQKEVKLNFRLAVNYASKCIHDAELRSFYLSMPNKGRSVYRMALADFLRPSVVEQFRTSDYEGKPGNRIIVCAYDEFRIVKVFVKIIAADGTLVEEGCCVSDAVNSIWIYTTTNSVAGTKGLTITATAYDMTGNKGVRSVQL
jgi:hypothetical protein